MPSVHCTPSSRFKTPPYNLRRALTISFGDRRNMKEECARLGSPISIKFQALEHTCCSTASHPTTAALKQKKWLTVFLGVNTKTLRAECAGSAFYAHSGLISLATLPHADLTHDKSRRPFTTFLRNLAFSPPINPRTLSLVQVGQICSRMFQAIYCGTTFCCRELMRYIS